MPIKAFARRHWPAAVVLAAAALVFSPALGNGFVSWDDLENFVRNHAYRGLGLSHLRWMFVTSAQKGNYEPLNWLVLAVTDAVWGSSPRAYHGVGLLLHLGVALTLYFVVARLIALARGAALAEDRLAAGIAALLFALHPLRAECVAWASGQHYALAALFFLLSVLAYLHAWHRAAAASFVLSLLSFPIGMTLPFVLLILDAYPLRRLGKKALIEKTPYLAAAGAAFAAIFAARAAGGYMAPVQEYDWASRAAQAVYGMGFYLWKTAYPTGLSPFYPLKALKLWDPAVLVAAAAVVAITAAAVAARRRYPAALAAWAYYLVTLLPVLGLAQSGRQMAADRYSYLPALGLAALAGAGLLPLLRARAPIRAAAVALAASAVFGLGALTRAQTLVWRDSESLWRHAVAINPAHANAYYNLGAALDGERRWAEAALHYQEALRLNPAYADAHNNIGVILDREGDRKRAAWHYVQALRADPRHFEAYNNLGIVTARQGDLAGAVSHFRKALEIKPDYLHAHSNLGAALEKQGRFEEAADHLRRIVELDPADRRARERLARALARRAEHQ